MPDPKLIEVAEEWMFAFSALPNSNRTVLVTDGEDRYAIAYYNHKLKGWALDKPHTMTCKTESCGTQHLGETEVLDGPVFGWMDIP